MVNLLQKFFGDKAKCAAWTVVTLLFFCTVLIINFLTPLLADDFYYGQNLIYGTKRTVNSLGDVFSSLRNFYVGNSGRAFTFLLYHLFFALDKWVFNVASSLTYMGVLVLIYNIIRGKGRHSLTLFILVNLSLWLFSPEFGQDVFWMSGAINYLFPMLPILGVIYIYRKNAYDDKNKDSVIQCLGMFALGFIAGFQFENSSITVIAVALGYLYLAVKKKQRLKWRITCLAGCIIGYVGLIAAPGNYTRLGKETASVSLSLPFKFAMITYYWIMFVGVLTTVFLFALTRTKQHGVRSEGAIFAAAALISAYCMLAAPTSPERTWFVTVIMMTIAVGIVLEPLKCGCPDNNMLKKAAVGFCAVIIFLAYGADTVITTYEISQQFAAREELILAEKEKGETVINVLVYYHKYPFKANKNALYGLYDLELGENPPNSFNTIIADYYGVDSVIGYDICL